MTPSQTRWTLLGFALFLTACLSAEPAGPTELTLRPATLTVGRKEVVTFVATASGPAADLAWQVSGGTVEADGATATVTAPDEPGEVTLLARAANGASATAKIRVEPAAPRLLVAPAALLFTSSPGAKPQTAPQQREVSAHLHGAGGAALVDESLAVDWVSSDPERFSVEPDPADPLRATSSRSTSCRRITWSPRRRCR
jgi:hypothetical protein